jgi:hypothetical protein
MWRGGYRTVPIDLAASNTAGEEVRDYDQAFATKAPDYYRIDVGVNFRKNNPNWSWILSVDIQNVTGRLNVWDEYYREESGTLEQITMVGMLPIVNFKVEF